VARSKERPRVDRSETGLIVNEHLVVKQPSHSETAQSYFLDNALILSFPSDALAPPFSNHTRTLHVSHARHLLHRFQVFASILNFSRTHHTLEPSHTTTFIELYLLFFYVVHCCNARAATPCINSTGGCARLAAPNSFGSGRKCSGTKAEADGANCRTCPMQPRGRLITMPRSTRVRAIACSVVPPRPYHRRSALDEP
jgi:hypothetical protein